jgi:hypothetical protein
MATQALKADQAGKPIRVDEATTELSQNVMAKSVANPLEIPNLDLEAVG